jgi:hypothetical protein
MWVGAERWVRNAEGSQKLIEARIPSSTNPGRMKARVGQAEYTKWAGGEHRGADSEPHGIRGTPGMFKGQNIIQPPLPTARPPNRTSSDVLRKTEKTNSGNNKNLILMFCAKQNYSMGLFNVLLSKV